MIKLICRKPTLKIFNKKILCIKNYVYICDMEEHSTNYYGISLTVIGSYDEPDETTGYKGGWLSSSIFAGNQNIMPIIPQSVIDEIDEQILNER